MDQPGLVPVVNDNVVEITPRTWNAIAQSANRNRIGQRPGQLPGSMDYPPVYVSNQTGTAINSPYRAFSLGEPVWSIGSNSLAQCCFRLETYDAAKPIAVIQQPLTVNEVGLAVVVGPTLIAVTGGGSTSDRKGSPDSTGQIVPGSGDKVTFAGARPSGGGMVLALLGAASALVRIFRTPSGGIAANSSAACDELDETRTSTIATGVTVYNHRSSVVPGSVDVLCMSSGTRVWVIEGNCPTTIPEP